MEGPLRRIPPVVVDAAPAVVVAVVVMVAISVAEEPDARQADAVAYGLGALVGALLLVRRRWPLLVLLGSVAVLMTYYFLDYAGVSPGLLMAYALYYAAAAGRLRWALLVSGFFAVLGLAFRATEFDEPFLTVVYDTIEDVSLLAAVCLLGETLRSRRMRLAEAQARLVQSEMEREREAARRVAEERLRIARDMHDVLGHTIAAITVQAGYADDILDRRPEDARAALKAIRATARQAITELKGSVGHLRADAGGPAPLAPAPGLDQVDTLLDVARRAGLRVRADVASGAALPAAVELHAVRILQEALTNTIRHAGASEIAVSIQRVNGELVVDVRDDGRAGRGRDDPGTVGHGLTGMAERAAAVGGVLEAGPLPGGGFRVHARLPIQGGAA